MTIYVTISLAESRCESCTSQVFLGVRSTAGLYKYFKSYANAREEEINQAAGG